MRNRRGSVESVRGVHRRAVVQRRGLEILGRKKNLARSRGAGELEGPRLDYKRVRGGFLVQERARPLTSISEWTVVTKRQPTDEERANLTFAWRAVGSVTERDIARARRGDDRNWCGPDVTGRRCIRLGAQSQAAGHDTRGSVLGSDAFFPFRDGIDQAAEAGITAIVAGRLCKGRGSHSGCGRARHRDGIHRPATIPSLSGDEASRLSRCGRRRRRGFRADRLPLRLRTPEGSGQSGSSFTPARNDEAECSQTLLRRRCAGRVQGGRVRGVFQHAAREMRRMLDDNGLTSPSAHISMADIGMSWEIVLEHAGWSDTST